MYSRQTLIYYSHVICMLFSSYLHVICIIPDFNGIFLGYLHDLILGLGSMSCERDATRVCWINTCTHPKYVGIVICHNIRMCLWLWLWVWLCRHKNPANHLLDVISGRFDMTPGYLYHSYFVYNHTPLISISR